MEVVVAVASAAVSSVVPKLFTVLENKWRGLEDIEQDIQFLHREVDMISASIKDQISHKGQPSGAALSMKEFCDLAHNIEDCLDRFIPCAECAKEELQIHEPSKFRVEIAKLKQALVDAQRRKEIHVIADSNVDNSSTADVEITGIRYEARPAVGIEQAKEEIWALLVGGEASKLRVVSIVGFGGSGKTALAWEVYKCPQVAKQFSCRAWATMASKEKHDIAAKEALLKAIQKGLLGEKAPEPVQQTPLQLEDNISHLLLKNRCLIVIDNINTELWNAIKPIFPDETESRILVTTTMTSVANNCSWPDGYVYTIRSLSAKQSKDYLDKKVFVNGCSPDLERGSTAIVNKCDGHPLALVSVAKALQGPKLTGDLCEEMTQNLCSRMEENKNGHFTKLGQVLMNNYSSLPGNSLKTCLLYSSVFPNYHPVSRKTLTRRWLAEGYIDGDQEDADKKLDELIDRNIFQPIDPINNGKAKTCKPHGIMHQFMLHKSTTSNFIATSFGAINRSNSRHLVIENHTNSTACNMKHGTGPAGRDHNRSASKQLRPRSVTVFGNAEEAVPDLTSFELLRVLDLKECDGLNEAHLWYIDKLSHLKYLALGTLGSSVRDPLPVEMQKLHCLETLDLRKTKIQTLPEGVISLPHLAHLFGKIKLKKCRKSHKKFLQGKSNLQTLAGVVIDSDSGFPELMVHMKKLTKVKIWCEISSTDSNYTILSEAIHKFAQAGTGTPVGTRSLSLHVDDSCKDLLHHHQSDKPNATSRNDGYLSSLKLRGSLGQFHQFVMSLGGLAELCLTYTNLKGADLLAGLRHLKLLVCLKLVEDNLADLEINLGDFPSLQRLCLVVENPIFPTIKHGALQRLVSLQLLCGDLVGLCDNVKLEWFEDLQEVALDSMVKQETIKLWEDETKKHPKRPRILLLNRVVDPDDTGSVAKYVASCQVNNDCYTDTRTIDDMEIDLNELTLQPEPERTRTGPKYRRSDQFIIGNKRSRSPHSPERT